MTSRALHRRCEARWLVALPSVMLLLALVTGCQRRNQPNIILYIVDTMRFDALHCDGNDAVRTPAMDRVAAEGIRFTQAHSNASWTRPSVASLMTGTYPKTHGAIGRQDALRSGLRTLADGLRSSGYRTAAVFANPNIGVPFGLMQGFDDVIALEPARFIHDPRVPRGQVGTADNVVDRAIAWLQGPRKNPFFLLVFSVDPHAPYEPPAPYDTMYDPNYSGPVDGSLKSVFAALAAANLGHPPEARDVQHLHALYHGEVSFNDAQLARLLAAVDRERLTQTTLFAVTSDHGEEFYEHGHGDHGQSLYEELIHIPLLMRWPQYIAANRVYGGAIQLIDLYPTLLRIGGAGVPAGPGRDLTNVLTGRDDGGVASLVFAEEDLNAHRLKALVLGNRKLIYDAARPQPLIFDLARDPGEHDPQPGLPPSDLVIAMQNIIEQDQPAAISSSRVVSAAALPESVRHGMQALGYGDPGQSP